LLVGGLLTPACAPQGEVTIDLILPDDPALSPAGDRLAELTLVTWEPGGAPHSQSRPVGDPGAGVDLGVLPDGRQVQVALELRSATDRLIGYGRSPEPVAARAGEDTVVSIQVRRPFVFASGAPDRLDTVDSTLDPVDPAAFGAIALTAPVATAPTPDGAELIAITAPSQSEAALQIVSTLDHRPVEGVSISLRGGVNDLAVTADGRLAVVAHGGEEGGLSVVDLDAARAGEAKVAFRALGDAGAVRIAPGAGGEPARALALLSRSRAFGCDAALPASSVAVVELAGDLPVAGAVELDGPAADLAVAPDGARLYLAEPCRAIVSQVALGAGGLPDGAPAPLVELEQATSVAVGSDGRVWGAGAAPPTADAGARVVLASTAPGGEDATRVVLPPQEERAESNDFDEQGQRVEIRIDADRLRAFDLVALPGDDLVALLIEGYYHAEESGDTGLGPITPEIEITTFEYMLVDASTRAAVQRLRTDCTGFVLSPDAVFVDFRCGEASDQQDLPVEERYQPVHLSALYGGK